MKKHINVTLLTFLVFNCKYCSQEVICPKGFCSSAQPAGPRAPCFISVSAQSSFPTRNAVFSSPPAYSMAPPSLKILWSSYHRSFFNPHSNQYVLYPCAVLDLRAHGSRTTRSAIPPRRPCGLPPPRGESRGLAGATERPAGVAGSAAKPEGHKELTPANLGGSLRALIGLRLRKCHRDALASKRSRAALERLGRPAS